MAKANQPSQRALRSKKPIQRYSGSMSQIFREDKDWGVRLILKPFTDPRQNTAMEISAEISRPKAGRNPEIKIWFSGVPVSSPLRATDTMIWLTAMKTINEEARKVAEELKDDPPEAKKAKRKK